MYPEEPVRAGCGHVASLHNMTRDGRGVGGQRSALGTGVLPAPSIPSKYKNLCVNDLPTFVQLAVSEDRAETTKVLCLR